SKCPKTTNAYILVTNSLEVFFSIRSKGGNSVMLSETTLVVDGGNFNLIGGHLKTLAHETKNISIARFWENIYFCD
ncbi:hypothetical protein, partial [Streptococcus pyogenes]|uniref:hypothetical protein n=1 Tax=Streptococcus pyogenes TaxID=1314 RepID=UPI003DA16C0D